MVKAIIIAAALSFATGGMALAQSPGVGGAPNPTGIAPPTFRGQGNFTASTTTTAINAALSTAPNSGAFPTGALGGSVELKVQYGANTGIYVCWQGGSPCSAAVGEYIAPGESVTKSLPLQNMTSAPPTVVSTGAPGVVVEW